MTSTMFQFCWNDCSIRAEVNVKEQLSPLSEFRSEDVKMWRCLQNEDGVENTLNGITNYSFTFFPNKVLFCFESRIVAQLAVS